MKSGKTECERGKGGRGRKQSRKGGIRRGKQKGKEEDEKEQRN